MCSSLCVTLPSSRPASAVCPLVPRTITSAPSPRATSAIACAAPPAPVLTTWTVGVDAGLDDRGGLAFDLHSHLVLVDVNRMAPRARSARHPLLAVQDDELASSVLRQRRGVSKRQVGGARAVRRPNDFSEH
jgi:hypothetical protein